MAGEFLDDEDKMNSQTLQCLFVQLQIIIFINSQHNAMRALFSSDGTHQKPQSDVTLLVLRGAFASIDTS